VCHALLSVCFETNLIKSRGALFHFSFLRNSLLLDRCNLFYGRGCIYTVWRGWEEDARETTTRLDLCWPWFGLWAASVQWFAFALESGSRRSCFQRHPGVSRKVILPRKVEDVKLLLLLVSLDAIVNLRTRLLARKFYQGPVWMVG
jgi:hypothetical protein